MTPNAGSWSCTARALAGTWVIAANWKAWPGCGQTSPTSPASRGLIKTRISAGARDEYRRWWSRGWWKKSPASRWILHRWMSFSVAIRTWCKPSRRCSRPRDSRPTSPGNRERSTSRNTGNGFAKGGTGFQPVSLETGCGTSANTFGNATARQTGRMPVFLAVAFPKVFADVPQPVSKETGWKPVPPFAKPLPVFLDVDRSRFPGLVGLESLGLEHRLDGLHH